MITKIKKFLNHLTQLTKETRLHLRGRYTILAPLNDISNELCEVRYNDVTNCYEAVDTENNIIETGE